MLLLSISPSTVILLVGFFLLTMMIVQQELLMRSGFFFFFFAFFFLSLWKLNRWKFGSLANIEPHVLDFVLAACSNFWNCLEPPDLLRVSFFYHPFVPLMIMRVVECLVAYFWNFVWLISLINVLIEPVIKWSWVFLDRLGFGLEWSGGIVWMMGKNKMKGVCKNIEFGKTYVLLLLFFFSSSSCWFLLGFLLWKQMGS